MYFKVNKYKKSECYKDIGRINPKCKAANES